MNLNSLKAKDLGIHGAVFSIQEEDVLEVIQRKLSHLQQSGAIAIHQNKLKDQVKKSAQNPRAIHHLPRVSEYSRRLFDPSIRMPEDIKTPDGKVVVKGGTTVNPLDYVNWRTPLLLINGNDSEQVHWVKDQEGKVVLIEGKPFEISKNLHRWVYFDQGGIIVKRFIIKVLPTRITQEEKRLLIEEISIDKKDEKSINHDFFYKKEK